MSALADCRLVYPLERDADGVRFLQEVVMGVQAFSTLRPMREQAKRGAISGLWERRNGLDLVTGIALYDLEAFGPTEEWVACIVARYLREHARHNARFGVIEEMYDGFRARGTALGEAMQ